MERATRETLERLKAEGVRLARSQPDSKKPADVGWKNSDLSVDDILAGYEDGRFCLNLLADSKLAVIDIDDPKDAHAQRLMEAMDAAGVARGASRKGFHYYIRKDADALALLGGKERADIFSSNRKNAAKVGDLLLASATAYEISGEFRRISDVAGLYEMLSHSDNPSPTARTRSLFKSVEDELRGLGEGNRNNGFYALLKSANRRFKQAGVGKAWISAARKLVAVYEKEINPEDAGNFTDEKLSEIDGKVGAIAEIAGMDEAADICEAVLNGYLSEHENHVIISADGSRDDLRDVYEWRVDADEWERRGLGVLTGDLPSVKGSLNDFYCQAWKDSYGKRPTLAKQNGAVEEMVSSLKRKAMVSTPLSLFDQEVGGVSMLRAYHNGENRVYSIDPKRKGKKWRKEGGNRPEYHLLATLGEVSGHTTELWSKFLLEVLGDREMVDYFGMLVASAFVPSPSPIFVLCNGVGANGKSVLLNTLAAALNDYACTTTDDAFTKGMGQDHKRRLDARSRMVGKKVAVCTESDRTPLDLKFIKALTSGEMIEVGGMFKASSHVLLRTVPFVATNNLPMLTEATLAVRRRIRVVPFDKTFGRKEEGADEEADPLLASKLHNELPAIRKWVFESINRYLEADCKIDIPQRVREMTDQYVSNQRHPVEALLSEWLIPTHPDVRMMKLGKKEGRGSKAEYDGVMALVMMAYEHEAMTSKPPSRKWVKEWLSMMSVKPDGRKGRLNCKPSQRLREYMTENMSVTDIENMWKGLQHTNSTEEWDNPPVPDTVQVVETPAKQGGLEKLSEDMPW